MYRITKKDLEYNEKVFNELANKNVGIKIGHRYGYTAIDIIRDGKFYDTLIVGLTNREANDILRCMIWAVRNKCGEKKLNEVV